MKKIIKFCFSIILIIFTLHCTISLSSDITVYVTNYGSKYHRSNCQYLRKSKISIDLEDAIKNYEPCDRCNPPTVVTYTENNTTNVKNDVENNNVIDNSYTSTVPSLVKNLYKKSNTTTDQSVSSISDTEKTSNTSILTYFLIAIFLIPFLLSLLEMLYNIVLDIIEYIKKKINNNSKTTNHCPNCKKEISKEWNYCNYCGYKLKD